MTDLDAELSELLNLASTGDEAAIAEVIARFEPEIRVIARRQLGPALRPYVDSMDLVQSVHGDLLVGLRDGKFDFSSTGQLFALVAQLVRWKAARHWRKHRRQQRESGVRPTSDGLADVIVALRCKDNPAAEASERDQIEHVLSQLDPADRDLIALRLEGHSTAEVARALGLNPDVTRVRLSRLRKRLNEAPWMAELV